MLPEEIKKGLEICFTTGDCYNCPYEEECDAEREENGISHAEALMYDALNLIKELEGTHCPRYCEEGDYVCVTLGNALKEIAELEAQSPKWISVEERLPQDLAEVLICDDKGRMVVGHYDEDDGHFWKRVNADTFHSVNATHWIPMPEPPKEG